MHDGVCQVERLDLVALAFGVLSGLYFLFKHCQFCMEWKGSYYVIAANDHLIKSFFRTYFPDSDV